LLQFETIVTITSKGVGIKISRWGVPTKKKTEK